MFSLDQVLAQTERSLKAIRKAIKITQEQTVQVNADVTKLKKQTSAAYRTIQRHVEEQEQRHLASIDENYQQAEKVIAETLDKQETLETVLHSIQLYGQHLSKASAYDLTTNVRSLVKRSEDEVTKSVPELKWKVDLTWSNWVVKSEVDRVRLVREGEIDVDSDQKLTTVTGQSVVRGDFGVRQLSTFTTECNNDVASIVVYHNHLFIVHNDHNMLYIYDEGGRLNRSVRIYSEIDKRDLIDTWGMCLVWDKRDHSLVISDDINQCLWWLTVEKQAGDVKLGHPYQHKLQYPPYEVSTDSSGRAMVADSDNSRIYVYIRPGRHVMCLQLSRDVGPCHALPDQSDGYVVRHDKMADNQHYLPR